jgi:adenosylcobinamide-GDP ribazoletransferase
LLNGEPQDEQNSAVNGIAEELRRLPDDVRTCLGFFSRLPVKPRDGPFDPRAAAGAWPLAGMALAVAAGLVFLLARAAGMPLLVAALLAIATLTLLTGGLHEDGLADTADGFGGGKTMAARLEIMRDSRLGAFGGLAMIFVLLLKAAALASVGVDPLAGLVALLAAAGISRAAALWHWQDLPSARTDGLAVSVGVPEKNALTVAAATAGLMALAALPLFGVSVLVALLLAGLVTVGLSALCRRMIDGHTGDTIGAAQQLAETAVLVGLSAGFTRGISGTTYLLV